MKTKSKTNPLQILRLAFFGPLPKCDCPACMMAAKNYTAMALQANGQSFRTLLGKN